MKKARRNDKKAMIGERLMNDGLTADILREAPELMTKDLSRLKTNIEIYRHLVEKEEEVENFVSFADLLEHPFFAKSSFPTVDLTKKQCHLWFHGERNTGKTYMIEKLMETGVRCYQGPYNNDWSGFDPEYHQVVFFDEYRG